MKDFFDCFRKSDAVITLQGKKIKRSELELLGSGSEKSVYGIKNDERCIILSKSPIQPEARLNLEKQLCDDIIALGIKAQKYENATISVQSASAGSVHSVPVLITKKFSALAQSESLTVFHNKTMRPDQRCIGKQVDFYNKDRKNFESIAWNQKIIEKILNEYAIGLTFSLPIHQVSTSIDDSEHLVFEHAKKPNTPPVARYMFWDVVGDFAGIKLPMVPTLQVLKSGLVHHKWLQEGHQRFYNPMAGLEMLVNGVACIILQNRDEMRKLGLAGEKFDEFKVSKAIEDKLLKAISEKMLATALSNARKSAIKKLHTALKEVAALSADKDFKSASLEEKHRFMRKMVLSAISCSDLQAVKTALSHTTQLNEFSKRYRDEILKFAKEYNNKEIIEYLCLQLKKQVSPVPAPNPLPKPVPKPVPMPDPKPLPKVDAEDKGKPSNDKNISLPNMTMMLSKGASRAVLAAAIGGIFVLTGVVASMTALYIGLAAFVASSMIEVLRLRQARFEFGLAKENQDIEKVDSEVVLTKNTMLDNYYFLLGKQAEKSWSGYGSSFLSPTTYIPYSHAAKSFQVGRVAQNLEQEMESKPHALLGFK